MGDVHGGRLEEENHIYYIYRTWYNEQMAVEDKCIKVSLAVTVSQ
jgi:hypothetical protein